MPLNAYSLYGDNINGCALTKSRVVPILMDYHFLIKKQQFWVSTIFKQT